jgi:hypothetical protein
MAALRRLREKDSHQESWHILHGDIRVGWIGLLSGVPTHGEQWGWRCGLPQLVVRGMRTGGSAATFEQARADFETAWENYLPLCTTADFEAYRWQEVWTRWKYAMHDAGCPLPTQTVDDRSKCFCGAEITNKSVRDHILACHMKTA